ncbi:MAG: hypothetical protein LCH38_10820 [Proteobacteria bacterium]|nr:hypothetical protein [Pseudomonadota bacterium]
MPLTANIAVTIEAVHTAASDLSAPVDTLRRSKRRSWLSGVANGQIDEKFADTRTLAASANEDIDLIGALANVFGATVNFAEIAAIYIEADAANTNNVRVGPAASNGFLGPFADITDRIIVAPGQMFLITAPDAGWSVTAGTGDKLNIANSGGGTAVTYSIVVFGRTA